MKEALVSRASERGVVYPATTVILRDGRHSCMSADKRHGSRGYLGLSSGGPGRQLQPSKSLKSLGRRVMKGVDCYTEPTDGKFMQTLWNLRLLELYGLIMHLVLSAVPNFAIMAK